MPNGVAMDVSILLIEMILDITILGAGIPATIRSYFRKDIGVIVYFGDGFQGLRGSNILCVPTCHDQSYIDTTQIGLHCLETSFLPRNFGLTEGRWR